MLKVKMTSQFKKDWKKIIKRGYDTKKFEKVLELLINEEPLDEKYKDHKLIGDYTRHRECHIEPDWLLIYFIENNILTLTLSRTGTHSDLFNK